MAAVYCKLEHLFFDETRPHINIATAFRCNVSQLTKAVTGVDYKGGPHSYKRKATQKRSGTQDENPGPSKTKATSQQVQDDTLSSSNSSLSDSNLPPGLQI